MSHIKVVPISGGKELKKFVKFKNRLYKNHPYAIPTLVSDELVTLNTKKNPASDFCESQCFLAYNAEGKIVGRICGIINNKANQTWNKNEGRFGFFDFIEDIEVAEALLNRVKEWLKERGVEAMHGPLGFTDMDEEGMLVEGFEEIGTMATLYNYPYYPQYMEMLGFKKDIDWVEFLVDVPKVMPERIEKFANIALQRTGAKIIKCKSPSELIKSGWAAKIFQLLNKEYAELYGFSALSQEQIDYYVKMYIPIVKLDLIAVIADQEDNLIGFGVSLPSLSKALQRSRGKMLPLGWFYMLKALKSKRTDVIDLMLIAVDDKYQNKGLNALIMREMINGMIDMGATYAESNPELETNDAIHKQWSLFTYRHHKRRRAYIKKIQ